MEQVILVTGGTGTLGCEVVRKLRAAGHTVRVLSRHTGPDVITGNLSSNVGIDAAVSGVDTIIHCATDGRTDVAAATNLIAAAERAGTSHLVYISIVGVDRVPLPYYRAKLQVEQLVTQAAVPWTILRATQFHNLVAGIFKAQKFSPVILTPGFATQPVEVAEVADRLVTLALAEPSGRVTDFGGPEVRSGRDLARAWLKATGRSRPVWRLRLPGKTFAAYAAGHHLAPKNADGKKTFEQFLSSSRN